MHIPDFRSISVDADAVESPNDISNEQVRLFDDSLDKASGEINSKPVEYSEDALRELHDRATAVAFSFEDILSDSRRYPLYARRPAESFVTKTPVTQGCMRLVPLWKDCFKNNPRKRQSRRKYKAGKCFVHDKRHIW